MYFDQPKTIKLYLHPPAAGSMITLWPDFKIVNKPVRSDPARQNEGFGLRFLFGPQAWMPDWRRAAFRIRPDGAPVHALVTAWEDFEVELHSFCTWDIQPVTHIRLAVRNLSLLRHDFTLGVLPRSGRASMLHGLAPDLYASYAPRLEHWDFLRNTWTREGDWLRDGEKSVIWSIDEPYETRWVEQNGANQAAKNYLELVLPCEGRSTRTVDLALAETSDGLREARSSPSAYDVQLEATLRRWVSELSRLRLRPALPDPGASESVAAASGLEAMFNSLVCQCLQMLATADDGAIRPRQGGVNDNVWHAEAIEYLRALDRLGLCDWAEKGYRFFFKDQVQEGPDQGRVIGYMQWTNDTGAVLYGLAYHLVQRGDESYFREWRQPALAAANWIEGRRSGAKGDPAALGYGLFPPGVGHDWGAQAQYWCFTDSFLYMGLRAVAEAFTHFSDPQAGSLCRAADDYRDCLLRTLDRLSVTYADRDEVFIPNTLHGEDTYPPAAVYQADGPTNLVRAGLIDPHSSLFEKMERYFRRRGWMERGMTHRMTESLFTHSPFESDPWAGHTWYLSFSDMTWFQAWLARGERDKAAATLWAQMRYGMSPEFYQQERYADNDPTFCPWQPNASANGRLIMMLLDYFGVEKR